MPIALLRDLVAAKSPSREEGPAVEVLEKWLAGRGDVVRNDRNIALIRRFGPGPTLLVCSHHDTVPATASWTRNPWDPTIENGRMYGLGANDAKGCVAAMAHACANAKAARGTLIFAAVCEEEVGRGGLEAFLPMLPAIDTAIIGEPTGLDIAVAQNGLLILDCTNVGRAGHAARPHLAVNPIPAMCKDILNLERLTLDRVHPLAGATSHVVTVVRAGERHNVIPDAAHWTIDLRTTAAYTHEELAALISEQVCAKVEVRSGRFHPVATPEGAAVLLAARSALPSARCFASPTLSDWAHLGSIPAIKWGPGLSEVSHTADEWVEVAMVERAVGAYQSAIERVLS